MSSTSTSWSVQGNTKANGATTDGISNMTVSGDLTISGNKLTFGSGGIIEEETSSAALSFTGESYYSFTANTGQDLTFYLRADNNEDDADRWRLVFADGGQMTIDNFSTGAYVQQLLLTTAGNLTIAGQFACNGASPAAAPNYTVSNLSLVRTFDCDSTSDAEVADVLGQVITDLISIGIFQ